MAQGAPRFLISILRVGLGIVIIFLSFFEKLKLVIDVNVAFSDAYTGSWNGEKKHNEIRPRYEYEAGPQCAIPCRAMPCHAMMHKISLNMTNQKWQFVAVFVFVRIFVLFYFVWFYLNALLACLNEFVIRLKLRCECSSYVCKAWCGAQACMPARAWFFI